MSRLISLKLKAKRMLEAAERSAPPDLLASLTAGQRVFYDRWLVRLKQSAGDEPDAMYAASLEQDWTPLDFLHRHHGNPEEAWNNLIGRRK
ncbi:hypothetical protein [Palleronia marisminoris]|uniref:hypothetical protein n=1 Tax=Palleronia marisminoris TaxID=315423 RepID=UPI000A27243D|nr:hypothetical protein [Palleronia marisminoris]